MAKMGVRRAVCVLAAFLALVISQRVHAEFGDDVFDKVSHGYADSNGVKIHYASLGKGPLVVMVHGYPDFWYTWRHQMATLSKDYQVVAIDLRGYNLSDKPKGKENYDLSLLVSDVKAVILHLGRSSAILVGHDWGSRVAWTFAEQQPEMTNLLITCNGPHPRGITRERVHNPEQQKSTAYAQRLKMPDSERGLSAESLSQRVRDDTVRAHYIEAFRRSDFESMINYYRQNYPDEPYLDDTTPVVKVKSSVLVIHGMKDRALMYQALNGTWDWVEKDVTIMTVSDAGHFVQNDAAGTVSKMIKAWLELHGASKFN